MWFLALCIFATLFGRAYKMLVKQPPGYQQPWYWICQGYVRDIHQHNCSFCFIFRILYIYMFGFITFHIWCLCRTQYVFLGPMYHDKPTITYLPTISYSVGENNTTDGMSVRIISCLFYQLLGLAQATRLHYACLWSLSPCWFILLIGESGWYWLLTVA